MNRLALLEPDVREVIDLLGAAAPLEEGCFLLLREGRGIEGRRFLAVDPLLPPSDGWERQGRGQLRPRAQWVSAVVSRAVQAQAGLLFVHSHPDPEDPPGFSPADESAVLALAETLGPVLDGPFAAAAVHPMGWVAVVAEDGRLRPIDRIVSVGRTLRFLGPPSAAARRRLSDLPELDARQRDALGAVHDLLRELDVAIVGVGGLGSPMAEQVVRMGVRGVTIVDHDVLDTLSNVRRVFGSTMADLRATIPVPKVDVVGRHLDQLGLTPPARRIKGDVRTEPVFRRLLDADVVISGTDTHGSRAVLNELASTYLLPVIDVGVRVGAKGSGDLAGLVAEVRVLTPTTPCLWCRKAISADVVRAENLPEGERVRLRREGYLAGGIAEPAPSVVALTVLGAGLGTCALLGLLAGEGDVCPSGYLVDGLMGDSIELPPTEPLVSCRCRQQVGAGDTRPPPFLPDE